MQTFISLSSTSHKTRREGRKKRLRFTLVVFHFERRPDHVVGVRVHPERERGPVALGPVVVVGGQHLDHFSGRHVFGQHGSVVAEQFRRVVVDVLNDDRQRGGGRFRRDAVVDGQDFHLEIKTRSTIVERDEGFSTKVRQTSGRDTRQTFYDLFPIFFFRKFNKKT